MLIQLGPLIPSPFIGLGSYQKGAVLMGPSSLIAGTPALSAVYSQGVISFWANYDSSASALGDSAKIIDAFGITSQNSNYQTICSFNPKSDPTSAFQAVAIGCIGIFLTPVSLDFYLRDGATFVPLASVSVPYVTGNVSSQTVWQNFGNFSTNIIDATGGTKFWNGTPYNSGYNLVSGACGGLLHTFTTGSVSSDGGFTGSNFLENVSELRQPPTFGAFNFVGPRGTYDIHSVPWDVWIASSSNSGGTPTSGWHHYIFSFDVGSTVTDANGAQTFRVQCAMDRGGGPVMGGPIYDTMATVVGPNSQPFLTTHEYGSPSFGTLLATPTGTNADAWVITAPIDASCKWAYMYFGLPRSGFFDLMAARPQGGINLDYFITPQLIPQSLGFQGTSVTPCACQWMHTGDATPANAAGAPYFQYNGAQQPFLADGSVNPLAFWVNSGFPLLTTPGPPTAAG